MRTVEAVGANHDRKPRHLEEFQGVGAPERMGIDQSQHTMSDKVGWRLTGSGNGISGKRNRSIIPSFAERAMVRSARSVEATQPALLYDFGLSGGSELISRLCGKSRTRVPREAVEKAPR